MTTFHKPIARTDVSDEERIVACVATVAGPEVGRGGFLRGVWVGGSSGWVGGIGVRVGDWLGVRGGSGRWERERDGGAGRCGLVG